MDELPLGEEGNVLPPTPPAMLPPIPSSGSFAREAAAFSLLASPIAVGVSIAGMTVIHTLTGLIAQWGELIFGVICFLIIVTGFVLGILALSLVKRHGRHRIFRRALTGVIVNGLVICLVLFAIPVLYGMRERVRNRALALKEARETALRVREETKKDLRGDKGAESMDARMSDLQDSLQRVVKVSSGSGALVLKAQGTYLKRIQEASKEHFENLKSLRTAKIMDMSGVENPEDLEAKRVVLKAFLKSNKELTTFLEHSEEVMMEELQKAQVPPGVMESEMKSFRSRPQFVEVGIKIRETDRQMGESMLAAIDVLYQNLGKWKFSREKNQINFNETETLDRYNVFIEEMQSAAAEQKRLQEQLVNLPR